MKQSKLHEKINTLIEKGKIYEYSNRCWFTCYMTWLKLKKGEKLRTKIIEGKHIEMGTHYWLEIDNKEICDPHYKLTNEDLDFECDFHGNILSDNYKKEKTLDPYNFKIDKENYEHKPSYNWLGKQKWSRVWDLQYNN